MSVTWLSGCARSVRGIAAVTLSIGVVLTLGAACSAEPGAEPSVASDREINDRMFECLTDAGFAVTRGDNGEINFSDPEDAQFSQYQIAYQQCRQGLVADGLLPADDEMALREDYRRQVALSECLGAHGLPTAEIPSEDYYVEHDGEPYLFALSNEQWEQAEELCPEEMEAIAKS